MNTNLSVISINLNELNTSVKSKECKKGILQYSKKLLLWKKNNTINKPLARLINNIRNLKGKIIDSD